jgi:hypothetical protein
MVSYRQFKHRALRPPVRGWAFCYDEGVKYRIGLRHGRLFMEHMLPALVKPARTLWNEVIGFVFLCFAVLFGFKTVSYVRDCLTAEATGDELLRLCLAGFCTALMGWYGVSSFLRARKISRS